MTSLSDKSDLFMIRTGMDESLKSSNRRKTVDFIWLRGSRHEVGVKWQNRPAKGHHGLP